MKSSVLVAAALCSCAALAASTAAASASRPTLRLMDDAPIAVRGTAFAPREVVMVRVTKNGRRWSREGVATSSGTFVVRFRRVSLDLCAGMTISATGSRGSKAFVKLPQPQCPPPAP